MGQNWGADLFFGFILTRKRWLKLHSQILKNLAPSSAKFDEKKDFDNIQDWVVDHLN